MEQVTPEIQKDSPASSQACGMKVDHLQLQPGQQGPGAGGLQAGDTQGTTGQLQARGLSWSLGELRVTGEKEPKRWKHGLDRCWRPQTALPGDLNGGGAGGQGAGGSLSQTRGLEPQATGRGIPPQPESVQGRRTGAGSPAGVPLASSGADSLQSLVERGRDSGG